MLESIQARVSTSALRSVHDPTHPRTANCRPRERMGRKPPLARHQAWLQRRRRGAPARLDTARAHAGPARRGKALAPREPRAVCQHPGGVDGQPGAPAGQGRSEGHLPVGLAGGGRRQSGRRDVSRPVAVPGQLGADGGQAHQQHLHPCRPDPVVRGQERDRLLRADRGGRRSRFRRRAQCVRADEVDDRRRRGRGALRRPAGLGQEVRPHGRQGARAHPRGGGQAGRGAPGGGRPGRAHTGHCTHRRGSGRPRHQRCRRQRPGLPHR